MADNTVLNLGVGGDTVRDLARPGTTAKTQVMALCLGGSSTNAELLITAGQQVMAASVPVVFASNQTPLSIQNLGNPYRGTSSYFSGVSGTVSIPAGARIVSFSAHSATGGTVTIFGGSSIIIPSGNAWSDDYSGFVGPGDIVLTGTDSYYVAINQ